MRTVLHAEDDTQITVVHEYGGKGRILCDPGRTHEDTKTTGADHRGIRKLTLQINSEKKEFIPRIIPLKEKKEG